MLTPAFGINNDGSSAVFIIPFRFLPSLLQHVFRCYCFRIAPR